MRPISLPRRLMIALVVALFSAILFRGQVATALVTRGDEFLYRGEITQARAHYLRALLFDPHFLAAADRYIFFSLQEKTTENLTDAIQVADASLRFAPRDADLLYDRGLCLRYMHRYGLAAKDFAAAASLRRNPRLYHLAAWAALRAHDPRQARAWWRRALAIDHSFSPARNALAMVSH